jgi:hypothetical protein
MYTFITKEQIFGIPLTVQYDVLLTRVQPYFYLGFSNGNIKIDNLATGFWVQQHDNHNSFNVGADLGVIIPGKEPYHPSSNRVKAQICTLPQIW